MAKSFFGRKSKDLTSNDWKASGSFVRKPAKGWLHADRLLEASGVTYETKYVGAVRITESMRKVPFGQRGAIVREAISICCSHSNQYNFKAKKLKKGCGATNNENKKNLGICVYMNRNKDQARETVTKTYWRRLLKVSLTHGIVGDVDMKFSGTSATSTISKSSIKAFAIATGHVICQHQMESISFASIGEDEYKNMIGYVAKDPRLERACFIFESLGGLSDDIILTIGQAFELKYKEYINKNPVIQPVIGKFTDPGNMDVGDYEEKVKHVYSNHELIEDKEEYNTSTDYDHLFNKGKISRTTESDYNTLQHNSNSLVAPTTNGKDFATGASYMGRDTNIATVYDNPIAANNDTQLSNGFYDNPDDNTSSNNNNIPVKRTAEQIYLSPKPIQPPVNAPAEKRPPKPPNRPSPVVGDLQKQPWFHGALNRVEAEGLIKQDGEFLVRESGNSSGQFVLTGMRKGTHRHLLLVDPKGKVRTKEHSFDTVPALIQYHMTHNIPISSGTSEVYLIHDVHDLSRNFTSSFLI